MSQTERHYKIHHLLALGKCLGKQRLLDELGVSPATLKRDLAHLRYPDSRPGANPKSFAPNLLEAHRNSHAST